MQRVSSSLIVCLLSVVSGVQVAHAQASTVSASVSVTNSARADELFRQGKAKLAESDFAHACPLLVQSYQADAATGTLLAIAVCHEREGKLGSAYREYREVAARSKAEGRNDREQAAADHAATLENKYSSLTIERAPSAVGNDLPQRVTISLDGKALVPNQLGQPIPLDGGDHLVAAAADGAEPWQASVTLVASADHKTLSIPVLPPKATALLPAPASVSEREPRSYATQAPVRASAQQSGWSTAQWVGVATAGVGAVTLGVGAFFVARAVKNNNESSKGCNLNLCTGEGRAARFNAVRDGNIATASFVAGGALALTGLVLFAVGAHHATEADDRAAKARPAQASLDATPWFGRDSVGASMYGSF